MVIWDKTITMADKLREYDKETLKRFGSDMGLKGLSKLKKGELVKAVTDRLLDPEVMFYRGAILTDKEIKILEKGFGGPISYDYKDYNEVGTLNEMDFALVSKGEYVVPIDVEEVWNKVDNEEFRAYHKKASWVWKCIYWAENMYAFAPEEIVLEVVNAKKGMHFTMAELLEVFDHFPKDRLWTDHFEDVFISVVYAGNMETAKRLHDAQADKDFYIPTDAEVEEYYENGALLSGKEYQDMKAMITGELGMDREEAEDILYELWDKLATDDDIHEAMQWFWNQFEFEDDKQIEKIVSLFMPLANSTRMLMNRGHKPTELMSRQKFGPGHMPVITAGSSHAAEMLKQAAPEIQKMGFGLDLESNAGTIPVMTYPNGLNGKTIVSEKKIYPNDPCPCGSGKKYKKCCGR